MRPGKHLRGRVAGFVWVIAVVGTVPALAKTVYVSKTGSDANDGLTWETAKLTVQEGLNTAVADDQVWVAAGTYVENITLKDGVALYGGFAGNETDLAERDWVTNKTILDGDQYGSVVTSPSGATGTTQIDGFTIRNGRSGNGGGICCPSSSPTIANNTISDNVASGIGTSDRGGGIYCYSSSPAIVNNVITGNTALSGGGICCAYSSSPTIAGNTIAGNIASRGGGVCCDSSSPTISNNTIKSNDAADWGGGIYCESSSPTITGNTISDNTAWAGGGVYCNGASPTITGNTITENTGGGIDCGSCSPTIANNSIINNTAQYDGAGIACWFSSPRIENNTIVGNTSLGGDNPTGGIDCYRSSAIIVNNTISHNSSPYTGGVRCSGPYPSIIGNNTIINNTGHGIACTDADSTIVNNTILGNSGTGIYTRGTPPVVSNTIVAFNASGIAISSDSMLRNNCVFGNRTYNYGTVTDPTGTNGNISVDPQLSGGQYGGVWHLRPGSPCVDAGDDSVVEPGWLDLDGQARIQGSHVDIGADESDGTEPSAQPNVIVRVKPDGDDANDGSSWPTAKRTVQAAIDAVAPIGGDVWVKAGTYPEQITLRQLAHVYGGFAGSEASRADRDFRVNETILDGQQLGSVVTVEVVGYALATIDGFTIRNGYGTISGDYRCGGGIYCPNSSPIGPISLPLIANNTITANSAARGAGIYCSALPMIFNNQIRGNTASEDGGGIYCSLAALITSNTISGNAATNGAGGGVYCTSGRALITNNTITQNTAGRGSGAGVYCASGQATIANNTIKGNTALTGGGVSCGSSSSPTIANNRIAANTAGFGGGIHSLSSSPAIINNTITGNMASGSSGTEGAGICCDGGSPTIANTIVAFNGSGIYTTGSAALTVRHNCVFANKTYDYSGITDPTGADGNISADPDLAGVAFGNIHLRPGSPCTDAGDDTAVQPDWQDFDGALRVSGSHVDIGADESDGTVWPEGPSVIVRVSPEGDDANDGATWPAAKRSVQAGIDVASALGGEVWVQAGTYCERITVHPFAHVYGGFLGTEGARHERDWHANLTILDGQQAGSVVSMLLGYRVNSIDGLTIRNGALTQSGCGGGVSCAGCSPTIANNTIKGNTAYGGGGIGVTGPGSCPMIANNRIVDNKTLPFSGAGVYCDSYTSPMIVNNVISGNRAGSGAGVYCASFASVTLANNTITANSTLSSGGVIGLYGASCTIVNTIIAFNSSGIRAGPSTLALGHNCVFGNTTYDYSGFEDPTGTNGNISADPLFVRTASPGQDGQWGTADDDYGDLRLLAGSPCIDAGDNTAVPADTADLDGDGDIAEPIPFDLAGMARFFDDLLTPDTGLGTPPIVDMGAYEYAPATLQSSNPATGKSLWRNQRNIVRLTFDADIVAPDVGAVMIQEMIGGGTYGDDLSAGFTFTVEDDGQGQPRVLKIRETASSLQHRKWYAVRNTGGWAGVAPFTVQYVVQVGDANNDGRVLNTDFGWVNAAIPTFDAADDDRRDVNGDGRILNTDFGVLNSKIPSFPVAKPDGH